MREIEWIPFDDLQFNETDEIIHRNPDKSLKQTERLMEAMKEFGAEIVLRNVSKALKLDPQYVLEYYRKNVKKS